MLVVASDVHMTDREEGDAVTDSELLGWLQGVEARWRALNPPEPLTLLFLGDVVDLLRSVVWDEGDIFPWLGLNERFTSFAEGHQEERAERAAAATVARYPAFFAALRGLRDQQVEVRYLPGNHDFMVRCSPGARRVISQAFGVAESALEREISADLPEYDLWAEHGNAYDPYNLHVPSIGKWAFGDAVVIFLVNRLASRVAKRLNVPMRHRVPRALSELDNVEPSYLLPQFIMRIVERHLVSDIDRSAMRDEVKKTASELLSFDYFKSRMYEDTLGPRRAMELLVKWDMAGVAAKVAELTSRSTNLTEDAYAVHRRSGRRLVVFGHTHDAAVVPLVEYEEGAKQCFYINTGTWRRVHSRTWESRERFCSVRTASWTEFLQSGAPRFRHLHERTR